MLSAGCCVLVLPSCSHLCWVVLGEKLGLFCKAMGAMFGSGVERAWALESALHVTLPLSLI